MFAATALTVALVFGAPAPLAPAALPSQSGVTTSVYHGKFFRQACEPERKRILKRESRGHYFSTNRKSGYFGGYQMTKALARGAAWMMTRELKVMFGKQGIVIRDVLLRTEPHHWARFYQDMAFATVAFWDGTDRGLRRHWGGKCVK